jgi:tRNA 2-thiouridine synthesizing protein D
MGGISIILRRPPYGTVDASEAVRHLLGALSEGLSSKLILVDGGVAVARKGQKTDETEYLNMESGVGDCIDMGADVYVDKKSMEEACLESDDLLDGVRISDSREIADALRDSDTTMIF